MKTSAPDIDRRQFLRQSLSASAAVGASLASFDALTPRAIAAEQAKGLRASADSVIFIWLPGGIAQNDTWDTKRHTPFETGMRGDQLLGTCPTIPTSVDGLQFGEGLEQIASVMKHGTL